MKLATCMLRMGGMASPTHSASVTRITRKTSCVTVSTMITKVAKPSAVPNVSGMSPKVPAYTSLPTPDREPAAAAADSGDGDGSQRQQRQGELAKQHRPRADRQSVGVVLELPRGADRADEGVPARDGAARDGHEEHRPQRLPRLAGLDREAEVLEGRQRERADEVARRVLRAEERRDDHAQRAEEDGDRSDPEADVVHRLREAPDRQVRPHVAEGEQEHHPQEVIRQRLEQTGGRVIRGRGRADAVLAGRRNPRIRHRRVFDREESLAVADAVHRAVQLHDRCRDRPLHERAFFIAVLAPRSGHHADEREGDDEDRDAHDAHLPAVHHLAGEQSHQREHDDAERARPDARTGWPPGCR